MASIVAKAVGGPAALLDSGTSWLDSAPQFALEDKDPLLAACLDLWQVSRAVRRARGALGKSVVDVAWDAGVQRATVTGIEKGTSWPDAVSVARVCAVLGLRLAAVRPR